ncbi:putative rRNA-processing protein EBP2-like protein [Abeliophyllum distichum]|uniref:rRNA-processing protein EBP2-like protein n=1 Tax=Abeliophyllum distichum TaxID=126358 RepID=A0ABD1NTN5_9LAMI
MNDREMENPDPVVSETETESEEGEDEDEDVKLTEPSKNAVNNKDGLLDKLGDISWPDNVKWIHKLLIDIDQEQEVDVNDDMTRELAFYTQALESTRQAFVEFQSIGLPFLRPSDYYAEMVKSDVHMEKLKSRLLSEKRNVEEAEERRKARENKKLAKEIQAEKLKERSKQKKEDIESVKKWRKQRQQSGFVCGNKDGDFDLDFENGKAFERSNKKRPGVAPGDRSGGKAKQVGIKGKKGLDKNWKNRELRDSKFGFGGKKGLKKQNTVETSNDLRGFVRSNFSGKKKQKR